MTDRLPAVTLVPMAEAVWRTWRDASIAGYVGDMVRVGAWPADDAVARANREFEHLVPSGRATPGHEFRSIVSASGETVGAVWFGPHEEIGQGAAFVLDIEVDAGFRGRGYGRAALLALEPIVRHLGDDAIRLHLFGDNEVARNLYRSSGYLGTDVSMLKRLG
jgi:ribosomal protein S18 acetylase RimI-like enzyme